MIENKTKKKCPNCGQLSGVEIVYCQLNILSEDIQRAANGGVVALGGYQCRWDWEEELINTRCLQCNHEWHDE